VGSKTANPNPLSSDAYSNNGNHKDHIHNKEVEKATNYLFNTIIPEFADELAKTPSSINLTLAFHKKGINLRFDVLKMNFHFSKI